jgi:PST family polysaccharide transporter
MTLNKIIIFNIAAVISRVVSALIVNKLVAVYLGPIGYTVIGQFQNIISIYSNLSGGILSTGITQITAESFDDLERQHASWRTAFKLCVLATFLSSIFLLVFGKNLFEYLHLEKNLDSSIIYLFCFSLPGMVFYNFLLAILNGKKEVNTYVLINIISSLISLVVTGGLLIIFGIQGVLSALILNPLIGLAMLVMLIKRKSWFKFRFFWGAVNNKASRQLAGFGLMGITASLASPISTIMIRDISISSVGLLQTGFWQAVVKISELFIMLITTTLSLYYLPRIAEIRKGVDLKMEIIKVYWVTLPIIMVGSVIVFLSRDFIIIKLFSPEFMPMRDLFFWQLLADILKICTWILGYVMLGRAMVKTFIITEIFFAILLIIVCQKLITIYGLLGIPIGYSIIYFLHWCCMLFVVKKEIRRIYFLDSNKYLT